MSTDSHTGATSSSKRLPCCPPFVDPSAHREVECGVLSLPFPCLPRLLVLGNQFQGLSYLINKTGQLTGRL